jgi:hypothetical protein
VFSPKTGTVGAAQERTDGILQPQGLNEVGVYSLREIEPNLRGSGVKFAVISRSITYLDSEPQNDYQPNTSHDCLKGRQFAFHDNQEVIGGTSLHSTVVCSILLGEDENAFRAELGPFHYQGAAPDAEADIYEFWHFVINNVFTGVPPDADIITASIGNQFEHSWTRGIESLAEQYGLIVVAAIGNGLNVHDPLLYPGAGANAIGVGVVDSVNAAELGTSLARFALAYPEHSSFGPTADGRCKPDIIAPGNCLAADDNEPNRYEATGSWSSYSTPIVAGTVGLLVQKAKQEPELNAAAALEGGNCVIKAILMNSATKLPYWHKGQLDNEDDHTAPLDYIQGAGMLDAVGAYEHLTAGQGKPGDIASTGWDNNHLDSAENPEESYKITITEPAGKSITATVVWNRHYEIVYPFEPLPEKDSDLRLEIWAVDVNNPDNDYLLDYSDSPVDNVEHICHPADANYTNYEIVLATNDIDDPNQAGTRQQYGLAWNVSDVPGSDNILWYDLNADGIVNDLDATVLLDNWITSLRTPGCYFLGDMDTNGVFDENDFQMLLDNVNRRADWYAR